MLTGKQKMALRKMVTDRNPAVTIGGMGLTEGIYDSLDFALTHQEVIKIRFSDFKEKAIKIEMTEKICEKLNCENAGMTGHTVVLYRENPESEDRKVKL